MIRGIKSVDSHSRCLKDDRFPAFGTALRQIVPIGDLRQCDLVSDFVMRQERISAILLTFRLAEYFDSCNAQNVVFGPLMALSGIVGLIKRSQILMPQTDFAEIADKLG